MAWHLQVKKWLPQQNTAKVRRGSGSPAFSHLPHDRSRRHGFRPGEPLPSCRWPFKPDPTPSERNGPPGRPPRSPPPSARPGAGLALAAPRAQGPRAPRAAGNFGGRWARRAPAKLVPPVSVTRDTKLRRGKGRLPVRPRRALSVRQDGTPPAYPHRSSIAAAVRCPPG